MRTFILLSGMPGSGKSHWAKAYQKDHPGTKIVSSDDIRKNVFGAIQNFDHESEVWQIFLNNIKDYAKQDPDCTVIADATNLSNKYRKYYFDNSNDYEKHVLVYFDIPFEICCKLNESRAKGKVVSMEAMNRLHGELEQPSEEIINLFDEYVCLGNDFIQEAIKAKSKAPL